MGWENVFHCEWNLFGQKILKHYWPDAISYTDITKTDFSVHRGGIDILTGGFPCQGFSLAGNRLGTDDDRYLWPEMLRTIRQAKPSFIVGENVTGIISMEDKSGVLSELFPKVENRKIIRYQNVDIYEALYTRQSKMLISTICENLENEGYEVQPIVIPAASVQAPHRRDRVWFLAYAGSFQWNSEWSERFKFESGRKTRSNIERNGSEGVSADTSCEYVEGFSNSGIIDQEGREKQGKQSNKFARDTWDKFPTQPPVRFGNDGVPASLDGITLSQWLIESLKAAGNAIVPQVAYEIFKAIEPPPV